jgi:hypothetical protein
VVLVDPVWGAQTRFRLEQAVSAPAFQRGSSCALPGVLAGASPVELLRMRVLLPVTPAAWSDKQFFRVF